MRQINIVSKKKRITLIHRKRSQTNPLKFLRKKKDFKIYIHNFHAIESPRGFYYFSMTKMKIMLISTVIKKRNGKKDMKIPEWELFS